jgi:hypothetical protein
LYQVVAANQRSAFAILRRAAAGPLLPFSQLALEIPSAVSDRDNFNPRAQHAKGNCYSALEVDDAQTGYDVVALSATLRKLG